MYIHILSFFCSIWTPPLRIANKMVYCVLSFISPLANSCRASISFDNSVNPQFKTAFDCNLRGRKHFKIELPTFFCLTPLSGLKGAVHSLSFIVHPKELGKGVVITCLLCITFLETFGASISKF